MNFAQSDLPASITTVEQLSTWSLLALQPSLSTLQVAESVGAIQGPRLDANIFTNGDGQLNLVFRVSLRLRDTALIEEGSLYEKVEAITSDPIPPELLG